LSGWDFRGLQVPGEALRREAKTTLQVKTACIRMAAGVRQRVVEKYVFFGGFLKK
jgi:hypothetical protein